MSHFTVMIIWDNPEEQLAPFQENNMWDCPKKYIEFIDCTDELKTDYEKRDEKYNILTLDEFNDERSEYTKEDWKYWYYENPNAKWDWYMLGWRWSWIFDLKKWSEWTIWRKPLIMWWWEWWVDQAKKKDIDFEWMRNKAKIQAEKKYEEFLKKLNWEPTPELWDTFRKKFETIKEAREEYNKIKWVQNLESYWGFQELLVWKEKYVSNCSSQSFTTFAIIKDWKWYEKWSMGWWGMVADEKDQDKWNEEFSKLIDWIDDETMLSVYDCHI